MSESKISSDLQAYTPEAVPPTLEYNGPVEISIDCAANSGLSNAWILGIDSVVVISKKYLVDNVAPNISIISSPPTSTLVWSYVSNDYDCSSLSIVYQVIAKSGSLQSDPLTITAVIPYGDTTIVTNQAAVQTVQTVCRDEDYDPDNLQLRYKMDKPKLIRANCPNPNFTIQYTDEETNTGVPCTTNYTTIERTWSVDPSSSSCPIPSVTQGQIITLGGQDSDDLDFSVSNKTYELSNEPGHGKAIFNVDDILNSSSIVGACEDTLCEVTTSPADPFTNNTMLTCSDLGDHIVTITGKSDAGSTVTKQVTVSVTDPHPPVAKALVSYKPVDLDTTEAANIQVTDSDFGFGNVSDIFSWSDNCGVSAKLKRNDTNEDCSENGSVCAFSCSDTYGGGPFGVVLEVKDSSGNTDMTETSIQVIDAADRDGDNLRDCAEKLIYFTDPDQPDNVYRLGNEPTDGKSLPVTYAVRPPSKELVLVDSSTKLPSSSTLPSSCSGETLLDTIYEYDESIMDFTSACPSGFFKEVNATFMDLGSTTPVEVRLLPSYFDVKGKSVAKSSKVGSEHTASKLLRAKEVPSDRYFSYQYLTNSSASIYAKTISQPIIKVTLRCRSKAPFKEDTYGVLFLRISNEYPSCIGQENPLQDTKCEGGLELAGQAFIGSAQGEDCPEKGPGKRKGRGKDKLRRRKKSCVLNKEGDLCASEYIKEDKYCLEGCTWTEGLYIGTTDDDNVTNKKKNGGRAKAVKSTKVPLCCRS